MLLLYLYDLIHSSLLAYCSVLSVHILCLSPDFRLSESFLMFSAYVFITNMVVKTFVPTNRLTSLQIPAYKKRQLAMTPDDWPRIVFGYRDYDET